MDDLCDTLEVDFPYEDGHIFVPDETILLVFGTTERFWESQIRAATRTPADPSLELTSEATSPPVILTEPVMVRFLATHRETGENLGVQTAGGDMTALELPISQLPLPGLYDWSISIYVDTLGEQCTHTGTFVVEEGTDSP